MYYCSCSETSVLDVSHLDVFIPYYTSALYQALIDASGGVDKSRGEREERGLDVLDVRAYTNQYHVRNVCVGGSAALQMAYGCSSFVFLFPFSSLLYYLCFDPNLNDQVYVVPRVARTLSPTTSLHL